MRSPASHVTRIKAIEPMKAEDTIVEHVFLAG